MKFFKMYSQPSVEEYVVPGKEIEVLMRGCRYSEFQFLDRSPLSVEISEEGGTIFPDFIEYQTIPLISASMSRIFDALDIDYVFFKPVQLTFAERGISENYRLALPPRINCLNRWRSKIDIDDEPFVLPLERICEAIKIVIDENKIGRYDIFRAAGIVNSDIIVTERLKNALAAEDFSNLYFHELEE